MKGNIINDSYSTAFPSPYHSRGERGGSPLCWLQLALWIREGSTSRFEYVNNPVSNRNAYLPAVYLISTCYALPHAGLHLCKSSIIIAESVTQCTPCLSHGSASNSPQYTHAYSLTRLFLWLWQIYYCFCLIIYLALENSLWSSP